MTESAGVEFHGTASGSSLFLGNGASYLTHKVDWEAAGSPWGKQNGLPKLNGDRESLNGDSSLFSSSLPALFKTQLTMDQRADSCGGDIGAAPQELHSIEERESQTIRNLLPDDEDELLAGISQIGLLPESGEDVEDLDLFSSGGGLELECDSHDFFQPGSNHASTVAEHPFGEHPSRTLFVRNINSNVEDSELRALFEKCGAIRTLYTACKHRGFVMISYYDIRSARMAMRTLQGKPLRRRKLDIHFSIPKDNPSDRDMNQGTLVVFNLDASVSNDDLLQIFGVHGEIKEIRETPHKRHHKFIEFFDVRAAEAALRALNRTDIAGKRIKLEPSRPGGARKSLMQQHSRELDPDDIYHSRGAWMSSPPGESRVETEGPYNSTSYRPFSPRVGASQLHDAASPVRVAEGHNRPLRNQLLDQQGSGHPHSLPEFSFLANGHLYKSPSGAFSSASFSRPAEGVETRSLARTGSLKDGSIPHINTSSLPPANGGLQRCSSASLTGQPALWSGSPFSQGKSAAMLWQNMSHGLGYSQRPSESPGNLFSSGFSSYCRELSADRHQSYVGEASELSPYIHSGSYGSLRVNGAVDHGAISPNFGMLLPPNCGSSLDDRRGRRVESNLFGQADNRKHFQLDLERILSGEDTRTTLMIKNIPNKYTSKMLLAAIDEYHQGTYDFVYLPIDFKNKCNVGYAFINMLSASLVIPFYQTFNGKKWEKFNSEKVASLAYARIQGKPALIAHFQNSSLMSEDKRCRPIIFHGDGSNAGDQEPFPRSGRFRNGSDDHVDGLGKANGTAES